MSTATTVQWRRVSKHFGEVAALDDFSLSLGAGVHCILGANGAGKSTAFALLTGARRPDRGEVWVADHRVRRGGEASKLIGFTPQALTFPATLTVEEVLRLVAAHYPAPVRVPEVLNWAGLAEHARSLCGGLSGGQTRRLGLACALVGNAPVVVLDEPVAGLDVPGQQQLHELIRALGQEGRTVLVASHDLGEVEQIANTIQLIAHGRLVASDDVAGIKDQLAGTTLTFTSTVDQVLPMIHRCDPGARVSLSGGRVEAVTERPDAVARLILNTLPNPGLLIRKPTLAEAIESLLAGGDHGRNDVKTDGQR